jgi:hypothetical protein
MERGDPRQRTMKEMNSETHSCTHSLASFDTFALIGNEFFMILDTLAICKAQCQYMTRDSDEARLQEANDLAL